MTHELKKIVQSYQNAAKSGLEAVLATVVALDGSSYRGPGVRMLLLSTGKMIGAVSGGCVEKEVWRQAETVFTSGQPKIMTYDGRYRLGCEGILHILIEPFKPTDQLLDVFWATIKERKNFELVSYFINQDGPDHRLGTLFQFPDTSIPLRPSYKGTKEIDVFRQRMEPCFKLLIIGAEHDAVQLCSFAALTGWEVSVVASAMEEKDIMDFPGASQFYSCTPETIPTAGIDRHTAVILMTHSYVKDLKALLRLKDSTPIYLGLLGPAARREKLLSEFLEHNPDTSDRFFNTIYGPAGLNIGAETPQEIAISILAEILSVVREEVPILLRNKKGAIHSR